jgi:7,8-dihydro-6-hydroxymethylpterin-pyrophosphokinase
LRIPVAVGANVTDVLQLEKAFSTLGEIGQLELIEKSPGLAPPSATLAMVTGVLPVFWNVAVCVGLG